jgi:hypothetical protein
MNPPLNSLSLGTAAEIRGGHMKEPLVFEAACNGLVFGSVSVEDGIATARSGHMMLSGVLLGHALMWIREHRPDARQEVEMRLIWRICEPGRGA